MIEEEFSATTRHTGSGPVLTIHGELHLATAPEVLAEVAALRLARGQLLIVDLAGLGYCDSSGISALIAARNATEAAAAAIALVAAPEQLLRMLELIGLAGFLPSYRSAEEALAEHG